MAQMDNQALNDALQAIVLQQQQQQAQQDNITQILNRLANGGGLPAAHAALDPKIRYSGSPSESLPAWLQEVMRKSNAENWTPDERRRAAIGTLVGAAFTWQERVGDALATWDPWLLGLRNAFEAPLSTSQWQILVEGRRQKPGESGSNYVMEKLQLAARRATPPDDAEIIPYLIRGLANPFHQAALMTQTPADIAAFLVEIRRLEELTTSNELSSASQSFPASVASASVPAVSPESVMDTLIRAVSALTTRVDTLAGVVDSQQYRPPRPLSPGYSASSGPRVTFERREPQSLEETICYNCRMRGHLVRNCPQPNPRRPDQGNEQAGPMGLGPRN
jgi:hypothetical protein